MSTIVIAIGGNAILNPEKGNPQEQQRLIDNTSGEIVEIIQKGYDVVLTHAMGPRSGTSWLCRRNAVLFILSPLTCAGRRRRDLSGICFSSPLTTG